MVYHFVIFSMRSKITMYFCQVIFFQKLPLYIGYDD